MNIKLNKVNREKIVNSVIETGTTLPKQKEELKAKTIKRVREVLVSKVPKDFVQSTKNLPKEWFPLTASADMYPRVNPIDITNIRDDSTLENTWRSSVSFDVPISHPVNCRLSITSDKQQYNKEPNLDSWEVYLEDLIKEAHKIRATEKETRQSLMEFLYSVNSYKQVLEKMPEMERHLPDMPVKSYAVTVPVGPLLKKLNKLGFDQGAKP